MKGALEGSSRTSALRAAKHGRAHKISLTSKHASTARRRKTLRGIWGLHVQERGLWHQDADVARAWHIKQSCRDLKARRHGGMGPADAGPNPQA